VIAVGDSKAQESSIETCEISPCHTSNDYFFPVEAFPETLEGRVQKTSLDWRLQLAESKCPDGAGKALQLTGDFRMSDSKRLGFYRRGPSMSVMAI
jgi:hypothetical protein